MSVASFWTRKRLLLGALALLLTGGSIWGLKELDARQRVWIFQPSDRAWPGANTAGMQEVQIPYTTRGGQRVQLHGLWMPAARAKAPQLLFLHGARWNVTGSSPRIRRLNELGFSVLAVDYRGFGKSSQILPSEATATEDAHAAWASSCLMPPSSPNALSWLKVQPTTTPRSRPWPSTARHCMSCSG